MHISDLYEVIKEGMIEDIHSQGYILRHKKSGARVAVLSNDDENKVFYIGFRTTPEDETGVPHIIEHTVLCGSEKYPLKDPFIELAKGSLNTFLNAMTYPDKTVYPVASCNDQDFRNLVDVYMDAVLHPNIVHHEEIFKQEGWHYEMEEADSPLTINGVVYNEMKGAYSSPDEVLQSWIFRSLFPDNTYSRDSGGNPVHIPELTYQAYLDFYHKYYHPSNSYIYLYGNMDVEDYLLYLDREYLSGYDYLQVNSAIEPQAAFDSCREVCVTYSIGMDDPQENATYLSWNRVTGSSLDPMLYQAMDILEYALINAPGAPVKKALMDAGIGDDIYASFEGGVCQPVFSIVAKNANPSDQDAFCEIIRKTLTEAVEKGLNKDTLLAAINSSEFRFREGDFGQFPKGLLWGLQCLDSWLFDDKAPFIHLECLDTFRRLRESIETDYFTELIRAYLLENTHGSLVMVKPEAGKNDREEETLEQKLQAYKASLTEEEAAAMVEQTHALWAYQEAEDSQEVLETIPLLSREDLRKEAMPFDNTMRSFGNIPVLCHEIETNGIDYLMLSFDASDVAEEELGYLGILSNLLGYVNTADYSYGELSSQVNIHTGGINTGTAIYSSVEDRSKRMLRYEVSCKVLNDEMPAAIHLMKEIMFHSDFSDVRRLSERIGQTKSRLQVSLSSNGHSVASTRGSGCFSVNAYYRDMLHGIGYYQSICRMEKELKENPEQTIAHLQGLCRKLFAGSRLLVSYTGSQALYDSCSEMLAAFVKEMPAQSIMGQIPTITLQSRKEGLIDASQIQYVARCGNFADHGYSYSGSLRLLRQILSLDYLWNNVRVKGGAYGVMLNFMRNGDSYFVSYRDPNLRNTNEVFEKVTDYIRSFAPDDRDMTKYVIGTFGGIDAPLNPEARGMRSFRAYLEGVTYDMIQTERDQVRNASAEDVRNLADLVASILSDQVICVIGNEKMIREASDLFDYVGKLYK